MMIIENPPPITTFALWILRCSFLAIALLCGPLSAQVVSDDPADLVRIVYNTSHTEAYPYKIWTPAMKALWARNDAAGGLGTGAVNFDYRFNSQDPDRTHLQIKVIGQTDTDAEVKATFGGTYTSAQEVHYDLVRQNGGWLIKDVRSIGSEPWVLSDILNENP